MLSATQCRRVGAVLSPAPSHGSSSFTSGGTAPSPGQWAPRHRAVSILRSSGGGGGSSSSLSEVNIQNGQAVGTIEHQQTQLASWWCPGHHHVALKATVTLRLKEGESTPHKVAEMVHQQWLFLEFFSSELDSETGNKEGRTEPKAARYSRTLQDGFFEYEVDLSDVTSSFGAVGAVQIENRYDGSEVYIKGIEVVVGAQQQGHKSSVVVTTFSCNSWVTHNPGGDGKRVFFPVEYSYTPSRTPRAIRWLRNKELEAIRGNGQGERKEWERIYDYDVYNDLGNPDDAEARRPVLGGSKERPYPRRCRTGRPRSKTDPSSETRAKDEDDIYVPRDERFTELKEGAFQTKKLLLGLSAFLTQQQAGKDTQRSFPSLAAIDALYEPGYRSMPSDQQAQAEGFNAYLMDLLQKEVDNFLQGETEKIKEDIRRLFKFQTPEIHDKDTLAWFRDEEFARQTLAGLNPLRIQLVTELPIVSKLDEDTYGLADSLITKTVIDEQIKGVMNAEEAVEKKKLFVLDYHDVLLPYVHAVRELDDTTLYGSRTLFFLTEEGTLRPIAIELTRPKSMTEPQWRQVFTPSSSSSATATGTWLWQLAKTHVLTHDTGYHQLISHWLRTHCCVEPYIIAANRQLSQMHPIYRLLHPHFRFTMEINALARGKLINAGGAIESTFSPGKYSMELSSAVYDKDWRFDMEALPQDLIRRGMAEEVPGKRELKLTIDDYPYANDGLLVWDAIKEWASAYVHHYYPHPSADDIRGDEELQGWWKEVRTKGHGDKQHEAWWPELDSHESLVQVLATIMWVASAHHAAVNFAQYPFAGYFPSHPTIARRNMPTEQQQDDMPSFVENPEKVLLDTFPSQYQSVIFLPMLNLLSTHMPGEQYMGTHKEPAWMADAEMKEAFFRFNGRLMDIAEKIDGWNKDPKLKNRHGAGVVPYVLLKPSYGHPKDMKSVMEMGIPNSISI